LNLDCGSCGADLPSGSRFCNYCGTPVEPAIASRPRFGSPEAYTPKHLAEKILTSKSVLEGERKHVTVLFADLKGSMELLADRDPEEARRLLDPVLERMMEAVHHYEGTVNQVMGDGIMALFGAPVAHEDHAVRACYAALRMDVPVADAAWDALDPPQRRQRTLEAVKRLFLRESQVQPLVLLFEDLHWMDSESQALLDCLIETLPTARVLLLVSLRPEYQHAWGSKTYYTQLRIDPLPSESAEELLTALLGQHGTLAPLKRVLIERTEGNPFFLEESVQTLVETRVLVGDRGAYRMARAPEAWQIPATAQAIVAARIDRLPPEDKRLLQAASVIGKDVPFALLHAIADMPENSLRRGLTQLQAAKFLYETSLFPDLEYTFKHALTHEVAYGSVLQDRRRALHARIMGALEALYPDRVAEQVERLAYHAFRGELWEKAVTYLRQAGAKALARSAYREAATCFEQALAALHPLPDTRQKIERAIDLRLDLRQALFPLGEFATAWEYLQEAEGLARTLDDPRRLGWVSAYMSGHHVHTGAHLTEVQRFAQRFGLVTSPAVWSHAQLARALAERGVFDEGDAHGQEAIRTAESLDHPFSVVVGCLGLAYLKSVRGEPSQAARLLERAVAQSREWSIPDHTAIAMAFLGHAYARSGRTEEGISLLQQALTAYESAGIGIYHTLSVGWLGEAYLLADQVEDARACADRAVMLARGRGERGYEAWALRLLGEIAAHHARPDLATAEAHYGAAMTLASELEMRPLVAHCHLGLGRLHRRTGKRQQAQEHLTTATAIYGEMGMPFWLEQAEAELSGPG
jgi:tetratricopeptide (TPR) repeat protein